MSQDQGTTTETRCDSCADSDLRGEDRDQHDCSDFGGSTCTAYFGSHANGYRTCTRTLGHAGAHGSNR